MFWDDKGPFIFTWSFFWNFCIRSNYEAQSSKYYLLTNLSLFIKIEFITQEPPTLHFSCSFVFLLKIVLSLPTSNSPKLLFLHWQEYYPSINKNESCKRQLIDVLHTYVLEQFLLCLCSASGPRTIGALQTLVGVNVSTTLTTSPSLGFLSKSCPWCMSFWGWESL